MRLWYLIFYSYFKFDNFILSFFDKINPFNLMYYLPFFKKKKKEIEKSVKQILYDREVGVSIFRAYVFMALLIFFIVVLSQNIVVGLFKLRVNFDPLFPALVSFLLALLHNFFILKENIYIRLFKEFDNYPLKKRIFAYILSFCIVLVLIVVCYMSFIHYANDYYI